LYRHAIAWHNEHHGQGANLCQYAAKEDSFGAQTAGALDDQDDGAIQPFDAGKVTRRYQSFARGESWMKVSAIAMPRLKNLSLFYSFSAKDIENMIFENQEVLQVSHQGFHEAIIPGFCEITFNFSTSLAFSNPNFEIADLDYGEATKLYDTIRHLAKFQSK
jgi:hypothetical protein